MTLGKTTYRALPPPDSNKIGTTKTFDTAALSNKALQKEVFDYAQQLAGGKALELRATSQGNLWFTKLTDGTTINVRDFSSSGLGRWAIDVQQSPMLSSLSKKNDFEVKFK